MSRLHAFSVYVWAGVTIFQFVATMSFQLKVIGDASKLADSQNKSKRLPTLIRK
jgi:hypothetical protein